MDAIRTKQSWIKENKLYEQLEGSGCMQEEALNEAEKYLLQRSITDIIDLEEKYFRGFKSCLKEAGYGRKKIDMYSASLRNAHAYWIQKEYSELEKELERCTKAEQRLLANLKGFLIRHRVHHIGEMDYSLREQYEEELSVQKSLEKTMEYLKVFDRVKQQAVSEENKNLRGIRKNREIYRNQILFLSYLSDQKLAMEFDRCRNKQELVWDFTVDAPELMKKQIFKVLHYILKKVDDPKDRRVRYLLPLHWLYDFCIQNRIEDIELLEIEEIQEFEKIVAGKVANVRNSMQIVENARKILFVESDEIHWHANAWYMDRFHFSQERINPSRPVQRITFYEVKNQENRKLLKEFIKYEVGITELVIGNIRSRCGYVKKFMEYFEDEPSVIALTSDQIDKYFNELQKEDIQPETFNAKIMAVVKFYQYLRTKRKIKEFPFDPSFYLMKTFPTHHDRYVEEDIYMEILEKLYLFPETTRLILLNLWCTGLRISEVCTLKGNAYCWDGEDAWLKIYQIKMKADKMIPIPLMLYKIMTQYIEKNKIQPREYIFKGKRGAYRCESFVKRFRNHCRKNQIADGDYIFKSHDYRHTLATRFYDDGVSMQVIRDYLGHVSENMTKQYVDYMPKRIAKESEEYFTKKGNNLAAGLKIKKRGEKK